MTKQTCINSFQDHGNYLGSFVKQKISQIQSIEVGDSEHIKNKYKPTLLKKGDVIRVFTGTKNRPCVVVSVRKDFVIVIPMTSTESVHCSVEFNSRFFGRYYFTKSYEIVPIDLALNNFIGVLDDNKSIQKALLYLKNFFQNNIIK